MWPFPTSILPPGSRGAALFVHHPVPPLPTSEAELIRGAVPRRREEFARGRAAARAALEALGRPPSVIGVGRSREPLWPPGIVGSISHCPTVALAVVAPTSRIDALGVDVEVEAPLPEDVRPRVMDLQEAESLERRAGLDTVGFSAKESIHKAIHPRTGVWLDFLDVRLVPDGGAPVLRAEPAHSQVPRPAADLLDRLEIRWVIRDDLILTSAWVVAP
ncbi:MAG: 4'-phosphopantetheinyl transferase superfamily protein [Gemmatimonadota bacterium]